MLRNGLAAAVFLVLLAFSARADEVTGRFHLLNQDGATVTEASYAGKVRVVTFGYTFCPDICPTTLSTIAGALELLGAQADQVAPVFITVDPRRDTPAHLKEYMAAFGPHFVGLTGTEAMVADAAKQFKARYVIHKPDNTADPDTYFVDHSAGIYIMDRQGRFVAKLGHRSTPEELADRVQATLK